MAHLLAHPAAPVPASTLRRRPDRPGARAGRVDHRFRVMTHARVGRTVAGLSLDLDLPLPGGITALVGPAGAGKTLLLEIVAGFAHADVGRILIDDAIVFDAASRVNLPPRLRRCAYIP